jgi:ferric-dicitrate binding protein FerR (iron transport regulator)
MHCKEVRNYFADYVKERLEVSAQAEFARHLRECSSCRSEVDALTDAWIKMGALPAGAPPSPDMDIRFQMSMEEYKQELEQAAVRPARPSSRLWVNRALLAAAALSVVMVSFWIIRVSRRPQNPEAILEVGSLYRVAGDKTTSVDVGDGVSLYDTLRSSADAGSMLLLADGSSVEMLSESQLSLERASDGLSVHLTKGIVIVNAAKQGAGHLYVQTRDVIVSVVGTVFLVNAEEEGSRVAVIQGEVRVQQGGLEKTLRPGEQVSSNPVMDPMPVKEELASSRNAESHLALLEQSVPAVQQTPEH